MSRVLLPVQDASGRRVDSLSVHPQVAPPPALPHRSRLVVEGSRLRWEVEVGPFARRIGRRAEELLERTSPLRDALHEASGPVAKADPIGR